jgi:hypothetical protein
MTLAVAKVTRRARSEKHPTNSTHITAATRMIIASQNSPNFAETGVRGQKYAPIRQMVAARNAETTSSL